MTTTNLKNKFITCAEIKWEETAPGLKRKVMAWDERVMPERVAFETGAVGMLHSHPHTQIAHVESGVFEIEIRGEKQTLQAGDVFYVPPQAVPGAVCLEAGGLIDVFSPMWEDFISA